MYHNQHHRRREPSLRARVSTHTQTPSGETDSVTAEGGGEANKCHAMSCRGNALSSAALARLRHLQHHRLAAVSLIVITGRRLSGPHLHAHGPRPMAHGPIPPSRATAHTTYHIASTDLLSFIPSFLQLNAQRSAPALLWDLLPLPLQP